jgi:carboxyl-terminal processing protease
MKNFLVLLFVVIVSFGKDVQVEEKEPSRFESFAKLQKVIGAIEQVYVDDKKLSEIIDHAINGLLQDLDPHSAFMDKKHYKEFKIQMKGSFGGLGIVVGMRDGALTVISPIDDTPAKKAGVKSGDIILKINDTSTLNMTLDKAVSLMRGKKGTPIDITIVRKKTPDPIKINIIRDEIKVKSVSHKTYDNLLYVRISSFDNNVAQYLSQAIKENKKTKGLILDLRNNPGGSLQQAIDVVDMFIDDGVIVSQKGRDKKDDKYFYATKEATIVKLPVVVLVNGGSASASEIVSGALQDHKRAVVIGEKTFGKGSVQIVLPLDDENSESIKLTIARYYLPNGRTIQAKGVKPDIEVADGEVIASKENELAIKEKDLQKHLETELEKVSKDKKVEEKSEDDSKKTIFTKEDILKDNQLNSAINILKSLILIQK